MPVLELGNVHDGAQFGLAQEFNSVVLKALPKPTKQVATHFIGDLSFAADFQYQLLQLYGKVQIDWLYTFDVLNRTLASLRLRLHSITLPTLMRDHASPQNYWDIPMHKSLTRWILIRFLEEIGVPIDLDGAHPDAWRIEDSSGTSYLVRTLRSLDPSTETYIEGGTRRRGLNLRERLLLEAGFFLTTGYHLDHAYSTHCANQVMDPAGAPYTQWRNDKLKVHMYPRGFTSNFLRLRTAVEIPF